MAFTVDTDEELAEKWKMIPDDTDILVTHSPPWGMFDRVGFFEDGTILNVGSESLCKYNAAHVNTCKLHVFGHIHEDYGVYDIRRFQNQLGDPTGTVYVNASHVNERYQPVNKPIRIEL